MTQNPGHGLSPVNAVADGNDKHLIIDGKPYMFGGQGSRDAVFRVPLYKSGKELTDEVAKA